MTDMHLWWIDSSKRLHRIALGDTYPPSMRKEGRLYLYVDDPQTGGSFLLYDITHIPNISLSSDMDLNALGPPLSAKRSDTSSVKVYDALRRSKWTVGHTNKLTRDKDDQDRETIDQDLYITTDEVTDKSNLLCFVNGLYHRHFVDQSTGDIYISDGAQTLRAERTRDDVTAMDFGPIGGSTLIPLTSDMITHTEDLPRSFFLDVSSSKLSLKDYTVYLIVDGYLYPPGITHRSINDKTLEVTVDTFNLLRNYLTSSFLRTKPLQIPVTDGVNPSSDMHDTELDIFVKNQTIPKEHVQTNDWILSRFTSIHSAVLFIPKTVVAEDFWVQHETNEPWWTVYPNKSTQVPATFTVDGKVFSPLYIHTKGYRDRTLLANPYREAKKMWSLTDPNGDVVASPDRDVKVYYTQANVLKLTHWFNYPILGEFR